MSRQEAIEQAVGIRAVVAPLPLLLLSLLLRPDPDSDPAVVEREVVVVADAVMQAPVGASVIMAEDG